ncbi:hypothetical protein UlMin_020901 [Ulmus minor]
MIKKINIFYIALVMFLTSVRIESKAAVICSPAELDPCMVAIATATPPPSLCCRKLREQRPCMCGHLKDPNLRTNINSPNARRAAGTCGIAFPTCY